MRKVFAVLTIALMAITNAQSQQLKTPAPSPLATLKQAFGLSDITIEYSRPSAKGRVVYGDVVPFGQIWRTGANGATTITFGETTFVEGKEVAAGTYALYSIPNKDSWTIMLYKDTKLGGNVGEYKQENELIRFDVKPTQVSPKVETFSINIADQTSTTANIELVWENTRVAFGIRVEVDEKIMKNIENVMIKDTKPYYTAARYYYDNNKDLKQALEWATKATEMNPSAYWVFMLKGNIQFKMGDKKGAAETAQKVIELAKADGDDAYVKMGEKLLKDSK